MTGLVNAVGFIVLIVAAVGLFLFFRMLSSFRAAVASPTISPTTTPDPSDAIAATGR